MHAIAKSEINPTRRDDVIRVLMARSNGEMTTIAYAMLNGDLVRSDLTEAEILAVADAECLGLDWEDFGY